MSLTNKHRPKYFKEVKGQEELKADYKGKEMTIGFNPKYLLDKLKEV